MNRRQAAWGRLQPARFIALFLAALPLLASPVIRDITPHGSQRGKTFQLVLKGAGLTPGATMQTTIPGGVSRLSPSKDLMKPGAELPFLIELRKDAPVGLYPLRILSDDGVSNVVLFSVGEFPEVQEKESTDPRAANGDEKSAEPVTAPVVINGTLTDADVDVYSFAAKAGQKLVFEVEANAAASAVDPAIELLDSAGKVLAKNDDAAGIGVDSRLEHTFAKAGTYFIRIHDSKYIGQDQNFYRLKIGSYPFADAMFPLGWKRGEPVSVQLSGGNLATPLTVKADTSSAARFVPLPLPGSASLPQLFALSDKPQTLEPASDAKELAPGAIMNGQISKKGEVDRYKLAVKAGEQWLFELRASSSGASRLDALVTLYDKDGKKLESRDDLGGADPTIPFEVPKGMTELTVAVEDLLQRGGPGFAYQLEARRESADFTVALTTPFVNVPAGGTAIVTARIQRRGYDGPLQLRIQNLPPGYEQAGGTVAPAAASQRFDDPNPRFGANTSTITITADPEAKPVTVPLTVIARADLPGGGRIIRYAETPGVAVTPRGLKARTVNAAWLDMPLLMSTAKPLPARLVTPVQQVRIAQGVEYPLNYKIEGMAGGRSGARPRENIATQVGNLRILQGPPGKTPDSGTLLLATNFATPTTPWDFLPQVTIDVDGKPMDIYGQMVTVNMAAGYQVWPKTKEWKLASGGTAAIEGEVYREPTFEGGLVKIEVQDLPEGVTCSPVEVPADQRAFRLECSAAAGAAKAKQEVRIVSQAPETGKRIKDTYKGPEVTGLMRIE